MGVTPAQHETLRTAFEDGYFMVPRGTNLTTLSDQLGVSDQSVSERLRRAESKLLARTLIGWAPRVRVRVRSRVALSPVIGNERISKQV